MTAPGPRGADRLIGIQYLRGIAATMVAAHHTLEESYAATAQAWRPANWFTTFGAAGVDVFFVISGLVMLHASYPAGGGRDTPASFLAKRFVRIYPLYWLCLVGLLACWAVGFYRTLDPDPLFIFRNALLWPGHRLALGVSWTLSYELYFYAIFAVMLLVRSRTIAVLGTTALLSVGLIAATLLPQSPEARLIGNPIVLEFALGLAVAFYLPRLRSRRWLVWLAVPAFAALAVSPLLVTHPTTNELPMPARLLLWGGPGVLLVVAFAGIRPAPARLHRVLTLVGDASYSIYLTHPFVMLVYARLLRQSAALRDLPQAGFIVVVVLACIALGIAVHLMAERPLLRALRRRRRFDPDGLIAPLAARTRAGT